MAQDDSEEDYSIDKLTKSMEVNYLNTNKEHTSIDSKKSTDSKSNFQAVVKKLVQANSSLDAIDLQPLHKRVLFPSISSATAKKLPLTGGTPITLELANKLREYVFGPTDVFAFSSRDWLNTSFVYHPPNTAQAWILKVEKCNCKGLIMCVQAYILKHMLFSRRRTKGSTDINMLMKPDAKTQEDCLASALAEILWKAGDRESVILCLNQDDPILENSDTFRHDGVTEKIRFFEFKKYDELTFNLKKYLHSFIAKDQNGLVLFLYSLMMTKGYDKLVLEMEDKDAVAILQSGKIHLCLAVLMITGRATPYLHNGIIYEGTEAKMAEPKTGILLRSDIGILMWNENKKRSSKSDIIGSRLKTPTYPIWLTFCNESSYGILFNPHKELMRDYHAENKFELMYHSAKHNLDSITTLNIDTREPIALNEIDSPALESLIRTKWADASISWNGQEPYI